VVVEGGLNDFDRSTTAITLGFGRLLAALEGREVVVVGPAMAPSRSAEVPRVDRLLARLAADSGVPYVPTSDLRLPYLRDRLHLTAEGHAMFGDAVAQRLAARGLLG
jgi:acyl-CoA thioesterase-1